MEGLMGHEEDLEAYRSRLLESLSSRSNRSARGASDPIQVYVNERRVGMLEGAGSHATLQVQSVDHIDTVQLRTEEGILLGGLAAPEYGFRTDRVRLSSDTVELCIHNTAQGGGSLNAAFIPAPSFWSRMWKSLAGAAAMFVVHRPNTTAAYGMRTVAFTQALLAIAVVGLVADRLTTWTAPEHTPSQVIQAETSSTASAAEMAKLEQQLAELAQMQEKVGETLGSQQKGMGQLQQAMLKLSSTQESFQESLQESFSSSVVAVRQELEKRQGVSSREADRAVHHVAGRRQAEQEQLEAAIHSLTADNDRLAREVEGLEHHNLDLTNKLQSVVQHASKASDSNPEKVLARQIEMTQPQVVQTSQGGSSQPFLFWVTFSEGTSQESIDQWVLQMKGHKGELNEGWQEVRIVPPAVPPDRFLEQIRGEKIVKAARIGQ
jgi:hypothetical protein